MDYQESFDLLWKWWGIPAWFVAVWWWLKRQKFNPPLTKLWDIVATILWTALLFSWPLVNVPFILGWVEATPLVGYWWEIPPVFDTVIIFALPLLWAHLAYEPIPSFSFKVKKKF